MATSNGTTAPTNAAQALATRRENGGVAQNTIADRIRSMSAEFQLAMPRGAEATQLVRDALTALRMTRNLSKCEDTSVLGALMTCAQLGLRPGVLGHAWLLPFWDRKANSHKAQLVIGYQGLIELAHRSGKISSLIARTVYEGDEFDVDYGIADTLVHKPDLFGDRGNPVAYYAIAKFTTGGYAFYVMSHKDMERYRDQNATARTREGKVFGPWVDHFEGMAHKTCVRQLAKYMPKSTELAYALAADEGVRVDLSPNVDPAESTEHPDVLDGEVVAPTSGPPANTAGDEGWPTTAKPADANGGAQ
ncbi:recombination protein RecT [Polymorphospora lycopeni]|uniref:Recombination protein RecT n=1 Tax=Polymorphospora lycopeni TaxID=3140240 RepID=A0ABV5CKQ8_9ACTN